ncbi:hypothetical protein NP493_141g04028 [Ridgeia piscesae]|uniref:C2H2-type domain-containing protein n=1 Tax=Ridgeia piscesae TaxID=27915 RepID=A0AAD9P4R4_RIDPI|nr:hypothetical protein NP493_141g04028 [Ridgeia piscesae]
MAEETVSAVTITVKNIKEETVSPDKSKKEDHSCLCSPSLTDGLGMTEIPEGGSVDTKCPDENKLCKKRKRVTPHLAKPRLSMNLRKRMVSTAASRQEKEEEHTEQDNNAVAVNDGVIEDICDVAGETCSKATNIGSDGDGKHMENMDKVSIMNKKVVEKEDLDNVSIMSKKVAKQKDNEKVSVTKKNVITKKEDKKKVSVMSKKVTRTYHSDNDTSVEQTDSEDHNGFESFDPTPVKCQSCTYTTNSKRNLRHHMRRKHMERTFKCTECDKAFGLGKDLREHMRSHSKQVSCDVCGKKFTRNYFLQKHFANKHTLNKEKQERVKRPQKKLDKPLVYGCNQCDYIGKTARNLRNHQTRTHGEKLLPCPTCSKAFAMRKDLNQHVRTHTQRFCCETCGKALKSKFALHLHRNSIHLGIKNTYVKHYLCTICGKLCNNKTVYREHQNKEHLGVRPFACEVCGVAFFAKASLRVHRRIHSDVRSHMCDICGKAFKGTQSLRLHQNIHRQFRPHKCEECNKKFTQKGALVRHMRIHTGERPFKCRLCAASFNDYSILRRHMMGIHKLADAKYQRRSNVGNMSEEKPSMSPADAVGMTATLASVVNTTVYTAGGLQAPDTLPAMTSTQQLPDMSGGVSTTASSLQCSNQTDMSCHPLPQLCLPSPHVTHAMQQCQHDHATIMPSVHGDDLQLGQYSGVMAQQDVSHGIVTVAIQDNGQVVTSARMQPQVNQQLTAAVQEAAHTLVHDVGRVSLTQLPPPQLTLAEAHEMGLPVRLLPGMLPDLQTPQPHLTSQQDMGAQGVQPQMY